MLRKLTGPAGFFLILQMALVNTLYSYNYLSYFISALILLFTVLGFGFKPKGGSGSRYIFMAPVFFLLSMVLSSGYLLKYINIEPFLVSGYMEAAGLSLLFGEFGVFLSALYLTGESYSLNLENAGYDRGEIETALDSYSGAILAYGLISVFLTLILMFLVSGIPILDIGLLPAILLFGVFYVIIFRMFISDRKEIT